MKDSIVSQRFLIDPASLVLKTTPTRLSRRHSKPKVSLQIVGLERRHGFQQAPIKKMCPSTRSTMQRTCATEGAETTINTSSTPGKLLYNFLTLQSRAGLCLSHLISPLPLTQYWIFYCIDIYKLLRGPASQTVPVRDLISNALLFKSADQRYNFRASSHSVYANMSPL